MQATSRAGEPITRPELEAALGALEARMIRWMLAIAGAAVAAVKLIPGPGG